MINTTWIFLLLGTAAWTCFFSMFSSPVRGLRNLGILAAYVMLVPMLFGAGWQAGLLTWAVMGLGTGVLYGTYELLMYLRHRGVGGEEGAPPRAAVVVHGLLAWPIMLPEVCEYALAELGVLRASEQASSPEI